MPNYVSNEIRFAPLSKPAATALAKRLHLLSASGELTNIDFENYIPSPPHMYRGNITMEDEKDFPCNWHSWQSENWGTKWNAADRAASFEEVADQVQLVFEFTTAWNVPYPIISAINNLANTPFTHSYFDEGENFWGVEEWGADPYEKREEQICVRSEARKNDTADLQGLRELFGYGSRNEDPEFV